MTMKLKTTFFHVLRIVVDGGSFANSEAMSRKRSLYTAVMFSDSNFSRIDCGRTKATYTLNHAIALFAREELTKEMTDKNYLCWREYLWQQHNLEHFLISFQTNNSVSFPKKVATLTTSLEWCQLRQEWRHRQLPETRVFGRRASWFNEWKTQFWKVLRLGSWILDGLEIGLSQ